MAEKEKKVGKYTTVSIPTHLVSKIKGRIEGTGFTSVSDYVTYVLREVLASLEEEDKENPSAEKRKRRSRSDCEPWVTWIKVIEWTIWTSWRARASSSSGRHTSSSRISVYYGA